MKYYMLLILPTSNYIIRVNIKMMEIKLNIEQTHI